MGLGAEIFPWLAAGLLGLAGRRPLREGGGLALPGTEIRVELTPEPLVLGLQVVDPPLKGLAAGATVRLHVGIVRSSGRCSGPRGRWRIDRPRLQALIKYAESWYYERCRQARREEAPYDDVVFELYGPGDDRGTVGEVVMEWVPLGDFRVPTARLHVFDDAFDLLPRFTDVWEDLACRRDLKPKEFCELLRGCGFKDLTQRKG